MSFWIVQRLSTPCLSSERLGAKIFSMIVSFSFLHIMSRWCAPLLVFDLFTVSLWSHCRSRSLSLMLSVNEAACIVPADMKRRHDLHTMRFSSSAAAITLLFLFFQNQKLRSYAHFHLMHFLGQRRRWGGGGACTGRHCQEVACPFNVISASGAVLSYLHHIFDGFVVVIWQQLLTNRHLQFWLVDALPNKTGDISHSVWWFSQAYLIKSTLSFYCFFTFFFFYISSWYFVTT